MKYKILFILLYTITIINPYLKAQMVIPQLEDGILTVGTNCQFAPYEFTVSGSEVSDSAIPIKSSSSYCDGYDMMWAQRIGEELGVDVEVVSINFDGLIPALNSEVVDVIIAGLSATPERAETVDFTTNYFNTELKMSIVTTKEGKYANAKSVDGFTNARISTQLATFHTELLNTIENIDAVEPLESVDILIQATKSGTIDGYLTESEAALVQAASDPNLIAIELDDLTVPNYYQGYAMATKKGDDSLKLAINKIIDSTSDELKSQMFDEASKKADGIWSAPKNETSEELSDGVLTVATDCEYAPYAFGVTSENASSSAVQSENSSGYCDGYDIMIAREIADYLGVDLEVKVISFDGLVPALNSGQIDAITAGMSATPERKESMNFSDNYYDNDLVMSIVLNKNSNYASASSINDFTDAKLSSQLGTFHGDVLASLPGVDIQMPMESPDSLIQATKNGVIDGYITEHEVAVSQAKSSDQLIYVDLNDLQLDPGFSGVAIGIKKGSDEFTNQINQALATISNADRQKMMDEATAKNDGTFEDKQSFLLNSANLFWNNKELYASGLKTTLVVSLLGTIFGVLIGFVIVLMRIQQIHYKDKLLIKVIKKTSKFIAILYIDIIRGTPMMVQAMLFFYGIVANIMEPNSAGIIIISFNTAAYVAEILRGGINSLDIGQVEAARSLGLSEVQTFIYIVVPQTIKSTLPALANQMILNIKDSSVLSVIAVSELFYATKQAASAGYMYTEAYFISAIIYLVLTIALTRLLSVVMRKLLDDQHADDVMTLQNIEEVV